jgi:hypothetical protein
MYGVKSSSLIALSPDCGHRSVGVLSMYGVKSSSLVALSPDCGHRSVGVLSMYGVKSSSLIALSRRITTHCRLLSKGYREIT